MDREPELLDLLAGGHPPAFATDSRDRVVFCNSGAAEILGRPADEILGRRCYDAVAGRDVFGNLFCYANCPVAAALRAGDRVGGFELSLAANGRSRCLAKVTILRIPSLRPDLFTAVHILEPIADDSRLASALARLGAAPIDSPCPAPGGAGASPTEAPLTARERDVLQHVAAGLQNKEVARELGLSVATVRNHVHNILDKLAVHSKLEAVSLAFRRGWVRPRGAGVAAASPPRHA
jgi:DNA-binding CsgD family transcriptional regulator